MITVIVNGKKQSYPPETTVAQVVEAMGVRKDLTAVEQNGSMLCREEWAETALQDGMRLEVVSFVGGG
ncbi:MAG: sulfur carrier protein ThiS [Acidaminococcus sp.]|nr:sulfur carrier protein ThiS [Acidaminococcus sp.]MCI2100104.1 sulfur carrier protein ThiS [Acidaminococcus sp.]MCI2114381.1 sulfur carrier protein ThiS [Acidaminococcus sp.]MCI2116314.1 sulfur carrier protein ThiS [Acidaminococcus sp.]